ncbi:MAG: hypothetical protein QMD06_01670 [Candidatus Altarchaeum sp.]|nr:hypothetical protein [Candidatus Altarchaeum sp.]
MAYKKDEEKFKGLAEERIEILFGLAKTDTEESAKEYVKSAIKIAKFCNLRLGNKKGLFCRQCQTFLNPENSMVRLNSKKKRVEILCLRCKYKRFYGYGKEQKEKRREKYISKNLIKKFNHQK